MEWMIAIYMILMASGQGPNAIGLTVAQVHNAATRYERTGVLPTNETIRQPAKLPKGRYSR